MGLLDAISGALGPALNVAGQAGSTYQGAEAQAAQTNREGMLNAMMMMRQQREFESKLALQNAQTAESTSKGALNLHEANKLQPGDPGYVGMMGDIAGAQAGAKLPADLQLAVQKGAIDRATGESIARIRGGYELGAAGIGANSRIQAANIGQTGANTRQASDQTFQRNIIPVRAQSTLYNTEQGDRYKAKTSLTGQIIDRMGGLPQPDAPAPQVGPQPTAPGAPKAPLTSRVQQLKTQGYSQNAAKAQLLDEGYDLSGGAE